MKRLIAAVAVVVAVAITGTTNVSAPGAATRPTELSQLASVFANRYVKVQCETTEENPQLGINGAWGYVFVPTSQQGVTYVWDEACKGALAIASDDPVVTDYMKVNGIETIVHEAYHLRRVKGNQDEALTECRAMRHYDIAFRLMGASEKVLDRLMPLALLDHWRFRARIPRYNRKGCDMPLRYDKWFGYPPRED